MKARDYQIEAKRAILHSSIGKIISPTGTGKSVIQGMVIETLAKCMGKETPAIVVILTPRIALTNQLAKDVGRQLLARNVKLKFVTVHSGEKADFLYEGEDENGIPDVLRAQLERLGGKIVTNAADLASEIKGEQYNGMPLVICCTYHSCDKITAALRDNNIRAHEVLCDEAHYVVEPEFHEKVAALKEHTARMHFFTATEKTNKDGVSDTGFGMQNEAFYGPTLFYRTPRQMIEAGWIVQPRLHVEYAPANKTEGALVIGAYLEHAKQVDYNAKLLVCCNGAEVVEAIAHDATFLQETADNNITVFRISSAHGAWIGNEDYTKRRNEFFRKMRAFEGRAIVLHINILTEGIDVPDFSGVMILRNMELARFMQSVGRAMRKHALDKAKTVAEFEHWIKKYSWIVLVEREGDLEDVDRNTNLRTLLKRMRDAGYLDGVDLRTEVVLSYDKGEGNIEIDRTNEPEDSVTTKFSDLFDIFHTFESEEKARIASQRVGSLVKDFVDSAGW